MNPQEIKKAIEKLDTLSRNSQFDEAKAFALKLIEFIEIKEDSVFLAHIYNHLGIICENISDYPKALEYLEFSLQINKEIGSKAGIARSLSHIGIVFSSLSNFPKSLEYYEKALHIYEEIGINIGISANLGNIGLVYQRLSDYPKAIEYYEKALQINEEIGNKNYIATNLGNIGSVFFRLSNYNNAIEYSKKALQIFEELGIKDGISANLGQIGGVYLSLSDYSKALEYFEKALQINEEIGNKLGIGTNLENIGYIYKELSNFTKALEYFYSSLNFKEEIGNKIGIASTLLNIGETYKELSDFPKAIESIKKSLELSLEIGSKEIQKHCLEVFSQIYDNIGEIEQAFIYYKQFIEVKDEILSEETKNKAQQFDQRRKIEEDEKSRQLKLARFQEQEKILHNILPSKIADRILNQETFIADHFNSVSVLFMDLVGFTALSSIVPPKQLVYLLDTIFQRADEVLEKFGLEKIKTIGDGYLAVANVTTPLEEHQKASALAALQLLETMRDFKVNIPSDIGETTWTKDMNDIEIRIGIHTGEVVAGIIGKNKYTYDLWGDAVNIASRMESHSEAGRIHISEDFAKSIENHPEFSIIPRGEITIKGKGIMNTYWLEKS